MRFLFRLNSGLILWQSRKQITYEKKFFVCLYRGIKIEDPSSAAVIEQAGESKSITMFSNTEVRPLVEEVEHIYDSTIITS